jgi:Holliday junction resolvasome RuvABC endonuclease subunit
MNVLGLDLSLTCTGAAGRNGTGTFKSLHRGMQRLAQLRDAVLLAASGPGDPVDLVVIEDYAFHKADAHAHALGELGGVVRLALFEAGVPYVDVKASSVKKYATGKGNAPKEGMLAAAIRRLDYQGQSFDEVDALWLRAMALDHYGEPLVEMPGLNRSALAAVPWPELEAAA